MHHFRKIRREKRKYRNYRESINNTCVAETESNKIRTIFKWIYYITDSLATLSILLGVILFIYGRISNNNQSDNDLIMKQIRKEVGDMKISSISAEDLHGFGTDSIVVTAYNKDENVESAGHLMILDRVENKILREMNDLLGYKGLYKTTFSQNLLLEGTRLIPYNVVFFNADKDPTKEFIVHYYFMGADYDAVFPAVYRYSYEKAQYELFGTLPIPHYVDNKMYDKNGNVGGQRVVYENTSIDGYVPEDAYCMFMPEMLSDGKNEYELPMYSNSSCYYFAKNRGEKEANNIVTLYKLQDGEQYGLNIYFPCVEDGKLVWGLVESYISSELSGSSSLYDIQMFLDKNSYETWKLINVGSRTK